VTHVIAPESTHAQEQRIALRAPGIAAGVAFIAGFATNAGFDLAPAKLSLPGRNSRASYDKIERSFPRPAKPH